MNKYYSLKFQQFLFSEFFYKLMIVFPRADEVRFGRPRVRLKPLLETILQTLFFSLKISIFSVHFSVHILENLD